MFIFVANSFVLMLNVKQRTEEAIISYLKHRL